MPRPMPRPMSQQMPRRMSMCLLGDKITNLKCRSTKAEALTVYQSDREKGNPILVNT